MIRTIVAATDGSDHAAKALRLACDLAGKYKARLVLLHVLLSNARSDTLRGLADRTQLSEDMRRLLDSYEADFQAAIASAGGTVYMPAPAPHELLVAVGRQIAAAAERSAREAGVGDVSATVSGGDPADAILDCARREKADLIVLGSRGLGEIKGLLLGSVSHKISAQAECPVLTAK